MSESMIILQSDRGAQFLNRRRQAVQLVIGETQFGVRFDVFRLEPDSFIQVRRRFHKARLIVVRPAQLVMDARIVWRDPQSLFVGNNCLAELFHLEVSIAQSGVGGAITRLLTDRLLIRGDRFVWRIQFSLRIAQLGIRFGIIGLQSNRLPGRIRGFAILIEFVGAPRQIVKRSRIVVFDFYARSIRRQCFPVLFSLIIVNVAQTEVRRAVIGLYLNRLLISGNRFLRTIEFVIGITQL